MSVVKFKLPADLEKDFEVINTTSPILESKIGKVDFRRLTRAQAEKIIEKGSRYLRKKTPETETAKKVIKS